MAAPRSAGAVAVAVSVLAAVLACADAFHFYLEPGASRCFLEQLPKDTLVVGNYRTLVASDNGEFLERADVGVIVTVVELTTRHLLLKLRKESAGRFAFTSNEAGDHEVCIRTNQTTWLRTSQKAKVFMDLSVGEAGNTNDAASSQEKLSTIASSIRDVNSRVIDIRREQQFQKEQEEIFRDTSEGVNSRVVWFMLLQILVLVLTSALQLRHLTVFFHTKKVA